MKKIKFNNLFLKLSQTTRIMKLVIFLLIVTTFSVKASVYSQTTKLNAKMTGATVKDVFKKIEDQSEFRFFYSDDLSHIEKRVNINAKNKTVEDILNEVLENSDLTYKILENNLIIIVPNTIDPNNIVQGTRVTGEVTDEQGEPLIGVSIVIKGTTTGVVSDVNGKFDINVPNESTTLAFSFIGYVPQEIVVGSKRTVNVVLVEDIKQLGEVVVTAMGVKREFKTLGYAISSIPASELTVAGTSMNPVQAIYGKAPGVTLRQSVSGPTGGIDFKIRGSSSLNSSTPTRPLFVVDGTPLFDEESGFDKATFDYGSGINDLNPEDIESIDILKGAKASVLYGSQGANGVVLITTKNGRNKKGLGIDFSYQTTVEVPKSYIEFQNTYGPGSSIYQQRPTKELNGVTYNTFIQASRNFGPAFNGENILWFDNVVRPYIAEGTGVPNGRSDAFMDNYKTGTSNQATVALAGSGGFGNARLSYTFNKYNGIQDRFSQKKNSISFGATLKPSDKVSVDVNANVYFIETYNRMRQAPNMVQGYQRDIPYRDIASGYKINDPEDPNYGYKSNLEKMGWPSTGYYELPHYLNAIWTREMDTALDDKVHLVASVKPTIKFTDNIYFVGYAGIDYTDIDYTSETRVTQVSPTIVGGGYRFERRNMNIQEYRAFLNFEYDFFDSRLRTHVYGGPLFRSSKENNLWVGTHGNVLFPDWYHLNNQDANNWPSGGERDKVRNGGFGSNSMYSALGVAILSWDDELFLELNGRNDWSSTLPKGNNSYFYPGVALSWIASNHITIPQMQYAKLRVSFADVGREAPRYYAYQSYSSGKINGTQAYSISSQSSLFSGAIRPERKRELEFGFDVAFFKESRLKVDFSIYTNNVYDQIMAVPLASSSGATEIKINAGNVHNWGYELQIGGTPVKTKDIRWNLTFNTANQFSQVKKLYTGITQSNIHGIGGQTYVQAREGERMGNIYGHAVRTAPDGQRIVNNNRNAYALDEKELTYIGNAFPNFVGGILSNFSYKGLTFNATIDYSFGATLFSWTNYWMLYNGISMASLEGRDEEHGGIAYYINNKDEKVRLNSHSDNAPSESKDNRVYHDGMILPGVVESTDANGNYTYTKNETITTAQEYYSVFARWTDEAMNAQDRKFKNDYIKIRELGLTYNVPRSISEKLKLQNLRVTLFARNLWYLHRTLPNLDPESAMGTSSYIEFSPNPSQRTYGINIGIGF